MLHPVGSDPTGTVICGKSEWVWSLKIFVLRKGFSLGPYNIRSIQTTLDILVVWANKGDMDFHVKKYEVMHIV